MALVQQSGLRRIFVTTHFCPNGRRGVVTAFCALFSLSFNRLDWNQKVPIDVYIRHISSKFHDVTFDENVSIREKL